MHQPYIYTHQSALFLMVLLKLLLCFKCKTSPPLLEVYLTLHRLLSGYHFPGIAQCPAWPERWGLSFSILSVPSPQLMDDENSAALFWVNGWFCICWEAPGPQQLNFPYWASYPDTSALPTLHFSNTGKRSMNSELSHQRGKAKPFIKCVFVRIIFSPSWWQKWLQIRLRKLLIKPQEDFPTLAEAWACSITDDGRGRVSLVRKRDALQANKEAAWTQCHFGGSCLQTHTRSALRLPSCCSPGPSQAPLLNRPWPPPPCAVYWCLLWVWRMLSSGEPKVNTSSPGRGTWSSYSYLSP